MVNKQIINEQFQNIHAQILPSYTTKSVLETNVNININSLS